MQYIIEGFNDTINQTQYYIYKLLKEKKFKEACLHLKNNKKDFKSDKAYKTFKVKIIIGLFKDGKIDIYSLKNEMTSGKFYKQNYLDFINFYYHNVVSSKKDSIEMFQNIVLKKFEIFGEDIDFLIENKLFHLLKLLDGYFLNTHKIKSNIIINNEMNRLKKISINNELQNKILIKIKKKISWKDKKLVKQKLIEYNYDVVIDGGNIINKNNGNKYTYINLYNFLVKINKKYRRPLLVLNKKHLKIKKSNSSEINDIINKIKNLYGSKIIETSYNYDDDLYILYVALLKNIPIISSDRYKNHIYNFSFEDKNINILKNFLSDNRVNFVRDKKSNEFKIVDNINKFSRCIQLSKIEGLNHLYYMYIPTFDNGFFKILIK